MDGTRSRGPLYLAGRAYFRRPQTGKSNPRERKGYVGSKSASEWLRCASLTSAVQVRSVSWLVRCSWERAEGGDGARLEPRRCSQGEKVGESGLRQVRSRLLPIARALDVFPRTIKAFSSSLYYHETRIRHVGKVLNRTVLRALQPTLSEGRIELSRRIQLKRTPGASLVHGSVVTQSGANGDG
jgi:hypothetical protein